MKSSVTRPLIFFFVAVLIVLILAIYSFLYLFDSTLKQQLVLYGQMSLASNAIYADNISSNVKEVFNSISFDSQISKLLNYEEPQVNDINLAINRLESYVNSSLFVDSIYIYSNKDSQYYAVSPHSRERVFDKQSFFDQDARSIIESYSLYKNMQPIFRNISTSYPYEEDISYISFLRFNILKDPNESDVMMINVNMDVFANILSEYSNNGSRLFLFASPSGWYTDIIGNIRPNHEGLIADIIKALNNGQDGFIIKDGYDEFVVSSQRVMNSDIRLVMLAKEDDISSITNARGYLGSIFVLALLFIICIFAAVYIVKKILRISIEHKETVDRLQKERIELEYNNQRNEVLSLLNGNYSPQDFISSHFNSGTTITDSSNILLIMLNICSYYSLFTQKYERAKERNDIKSRLCDTARKSLEDFEVLFSVYDDESRCFISIKNPNNDELLMQRLNDLSKCIKEQLDIDVTIFVSSSYPFYDIPSAFFDLRESLPCRIFYKSDEIITSEMVDSREMYPVSIPEKLQKNLTSDLLQLNIDNAFIDLKEIIDELGRGSYKGFQANIIQFALYLDDILGKLQSNNGIEKAVHTDLIIYNLSSFESLDAIYQAFKEVIISSSKAVLDNKGSHQSTIVVQIKDLINQRYSEPNFSIITVSEELDMNASYLGKLFKKNAGTTFIEYLHNTRMEKACYLLKNTDMDIQNIVSDVGYSDVTYFYKIFKKMNGCTPAIYRKNSEEK